MLNEKLYFDGKEYFDDLVNDIRSSQDQIILESYIFDKDALAEKIVHALKDAEIRGVEVRVLVDGIGSPNWYNDWLDFFLEHKIECRIYHPIPWSFSILRKEGFKYFKKILNSWANINSRNHRKFCLIDRKILFVTGFNIKETHAKWRDNAIRLEWPQIKLNENDIGQHSEDIEEVQIAFLKAWSVSWRPSKVPISSRLMTLFRFRNKLKNTVVRLNNTFALRNFHYNELVRKINNAKNEVFIINPYFVPSVRIMRALRNASGSGVDIKIIVPGPSDVPIVQIAAKYFYERLLKANAKLYRYKNNILHAKTMIIDDWAMIGSSNLNSRSLIHDLELDVIISNSDNVTLLKKQFHEDVSVSDEITLSEIEEMPIYKKIIIRMLLWVRYWM